VVDQVVQQANVEGRPAAPRASAADGVERSLTDLFVPSLLYSG
jgi:hypothetical protein